MEIVEINRDRFFSYEEAKALLPVVYHITQNYSGKVHQLIERLEKLYGENPDSVNVIEKEINALIETWQSKMQKLGVIPKGLWIADFDSGDGYYCWKFPERRVDYWHSYRDGFSKRMLIAEKETSFVDTPHSKRV